MSSLSISSRSSITLPVSNKKIDWNSSCLFIILHNPVFRSLAVCVTAYSPLGSGDRPWASPDEPRLLEDPKLVGIAQRYQKSPAQVILRYELIQHYFFYNSCAARSNRKPNHPTPTPQVAHSEGCGMYPQKHYALQNPAEPERVRFQVVARGHEADRFFHLQQALHRSNSSGEKTGFINLWALQILFTWCNYCSLWIN